MKKIFEIKNISYNGSNVNISNENFSAQEISTEIKKDENLLFKQEKQIENEKKSCKQGKF